MKWEVDSDIDDSAFLPVTSAFLPVISPSLTVASPFLTVTSAQRTPIRILMQSICDLTPRILFDDSSDQQPMHSLRKYLKSNKISVNIAELDAYFASLSSSNNSTHNNGYETPIQSTPSNRATSQFEQQSQLLTLEPQAAISPDQLYNNTKQCLQQLTNKKLEHQDILKCLMQFQSTQDQLNSFCAGDVDSGFQGDVTSFVGVEQGEGDWLGDSACILGNQYAFHTPHVNVAYGESRIQMESGSQFSDKLFSFQLQSHPLKSDAFQYAMVRLAELQESVAVYEQLAAKIISNNQNTMIVKEQFSHSIPLQSTKLHIPNTNNKETIEYKKNTTEHKDTKYHKDTTQHKGTTEHKGTTQHKDTTEHKGTTQHKDTTEHKGTTQHKDTTQHKETPEYTPSSTQTFSYPQVNSNRCSPSMRDENQWQLRTPSNCISNSIVLMSPDLYCDSQQNFLQELKDGLMLILNSAKEEQYNLFSQAHSHPPQSQEKLKPTGRQKYINHTISDDRSKRNHKRYKENQEPIVNQRKQKIGNIQANSVRTLMRDKNSGGKGSWRGSGNVNLQQMQPYDL